MDWIEFRDRYSRFARFSKKEAWYLLVLVFVFAFIFSFDMWGVGVFDASIGLKNLLVSFILVGIVVLVHHVVQRCVCVLFGFKPVHRIWWSGLVLSLFVVFLSNGRLMLFLGSVFGIRMLNIQRLGWQRYGLNVKQQGLIAVSGNIALVLFVGLLMLLPVVPGSFVARLIEFSVLFAFFNMLPLPPLDGGLMMLGSRLYFVFLFAALIGFLVFFSAGFLIALFLGLLSGVVAWLLFYWFFEKKHG